MGVKATDHATEGLGHLAECLDREVPPNRVERGALMCRHTSFKIGGPADFLVTVETVAELAGVVACCRRHSAPFLMLGRGTNLLVRDGGIRGVVIRMAGDFLKTGFSGETVEAGASVGLGDLARECGRQSLTGLEFAVGIPGSLGGALIMNAGAYGHEMKQVVEAVRVLRPEDDSRRPITLGTSDLDLGYRTSRPQQKGWLVLSVRLRLRRGSPADISRLEEDYSEKRRCKQPLDYPSAGSVFKRPPGHYAGRLIEAAGLRGLRVGDAQVSKKHVGFIVNLGQATAHDVLELMGEVVEEVYRHSGVRLEPEVRIVGEDPH